MSTGESPRSDAPGTARRRAPIAASGAGGPPALVPLALVLAAGSVAPAAAEVYRWEDGGLVTYQDRAPDSSQDDGHAILNRQGVVLEEVLSREGRKAARRAERERQLTKIRDRALLATFTTEDDLTRTRDDRVGMIDGLISRLDDRIRILSERLAVVDKRIEMQERNLGEGGAQESLYAERRSVRRNIENAWSLIDAKAAERGELVDKFEADLRRYRELKAGLARGREGGIDIAEDGR